MTPSQGAVRLFIELWTEEETRLGGEVTRRFASLNVHSHTRHQRPDLRSTQTVVYRRKRYERDTVRLTGADRPVR